MRVFALILAWNLCVCLVYSQQLSEFHYNDEGVDYQEFVEVLVPDEYIGSASSIEIILYNGSNGKIYNSARLNELPLPYCYQGNCYFIWQPNSIQNGPDGIALLMDNRLIEFISYQGEITATDGPIAGTTSQDIGVEESNATRETQSLARIDDAWVVTDFHTRGFNNTGFPPATLPASPSQYVFAYPNKKLSSNNLSMPSCENYLFTNWYNQDEELVYKGAIFDPIAVGYFDEKPAGGYTFFAVQACQEEDAVVYSAPTKIEYELLDFDENNLKDGQCALLVEIISSGCQNPTGRGITISDNGSRSDIQLEPSDGCYKAIAAPVRSGVKIDLQTIGALADGDSIRVWSPQQELLFEYPTQTNAQFTVFCPEACMQTSESNWVSVVIGDNPQFIGWELRDARNNRIAFQLPGSYAGQSSGDTLHYPVDLEVCEPYTLHLLSAIDASWGTNQWFLSGINAARGEPVSVAKQLRYCWLKQSEAMYQRRKTITFTLPCTDRSLADTLLISTNCTSDFTVPNISAPTCYPYFEHSLGAIQMQASKIYGQDTLPGLSVGQTIELASGLNRLVYTFMYPDGQRIHANRNVIVQDEALRAVCNDGLNITARDIQVVDSCSFQIVPDVFLESTNVCANQLEVRFFYKNKEVETFGQEFYGKQIDYQIFLAGTEVSLCGGKVRLQDFSAPMLETFDYTIRCNHPDPLNENFNRRLFFSASLTAMDSIFSGSAAMPFEKEVTISDVSCGDLGEMVQDFQVRLRLLHSDLEDLKIVLEDPLGAQTVLMDYGTCLDALAQNINVSFSNASDVLISDACRNESPSLNGVFRPVEPLEYKDKPFATLEGDWKILIFDNDGFNSVEGAGEGLVQFVQLQIRKGFPTLFAAQDCSPLTVSVESEQLVLNDCQQPYIKRVLKAQDDYGNATIDSQFTFLVTPSIDAIEFEEIVQYQLTDFNVDPATIAADIYYPEFGCYPIIPENHSDLCKLSFTYKDKLIPGCSKTYSIQRNWTILDWCSGAQENFEQWLHVVDTIAPILVLDTAALHLNSDCLITLDSNSFQATDINGISQLEIKNLATGDVRNIRNGAQLTIQNNTSIEVKAVDGCGNQQVDTFLIHALDISAPVLACKDTLHLTLSNGTSVLKAEQLLENSYDNCGEYSFQIKRQATCNQDTAWHQEVPFDCCDVGKKVTVWIRIVDNFGNENFCWTVVYVQAAANSTFSCPADDTIRCGEDVHDWEVFGTPIHLNGCSTNLTEKIDSNLNACNEGVIFRRWYHANDLVCEQQITVLEAAPLRVRFIGDTVLNTCATLPDFNDWVAVEANDCHRPFLQIDTFPLKETEGYCRIWQLRYRLFDWCRYDETAARTALGMALEDGWYEDDDGFFEWFQMVYFTSDATTATLSGQVQTNDNPQANVQIVLDSLQQRTDVQGHFSFEVPKYEAYTLSAHKNDEAMAGIGILDMVLLQRYLLGRENFDTYTMHKADLDNSGSVSFSDLNLLQHSLLRGEAQFSKPWKIVVAQDAYAESLQEKIEIKNLQSATHFQLEALKTGDLDNSYKKVQGRSLPALVLQSQIKNKRQRYMNPAPIKLWAMRLVTARNVTLESPMSGFLKHETEDATVWLWSGTEAQQIAANEMLFEIEGQLISGEVVTQLASGVLQHSPIQPANLLDDIKVYPNPFSDRLKVSIHTTDAVPLTLEILDIHGMLIDATTQQTKIGFNTLEWRPIVPHDGVFILKISTAFGIKTRRIIRLK